MNVGRKITIYFVAFIALAINLRAQSVISVTDSSKSVYYSSPYVVNPFRSISFYGLPGDSLIKFRGFLKNKVLRPQISVKIDNNWQFITITERINGYMLKIPFTASFEWYFSNKIRLDSKYYFLQRLPLSKRFGATGKNTQRNKSIEVVGVDLGDFGRASLRVNGNATITGKMIYQNQELTTASLNESQKARFDIDQKQNLNIEGTIGDRISVAMDQDSERDFNWENNIRITYTGKEDEILQKIEAGNTSLSLPATQFVTFTGNNQGLFGVKTLSKIGPIDITTIAAVEQTKKAQQKYKGAGQSQTQKIKDYEYVKNQYFFIHEWFRNGVSTVVDGKSITLPPYYPLDSEGLHYRGELEVVDFELYKLDQSNDPAADIGTAYIDPAKKDENATYNKEGTFLRMDRDIDYSLSVDLGYIRLRSRSQEQILAAHYLLVNSTTGDTVLTVGHGLTESDSTLVLKMLKPRSPHPNHPTWDLMFKNVYNLGATNIDSAGFAVRIINNYDTPISDRDKSGKTYIHRFGLDDKNENGAKIPDEKVDIENMVFLNFGELHLPALLPFVSANNIEGGNTNEELENLLGEGKMYTSTVPTDYTGDSRFTIEADYSNLSSTINLGFMITEGSEDVKLDGVSLKKNIDYTIDYFSGTINIIKSDINPNADIQVKYEKNELVSFDKKVILGSRAQMDIGENAFIGATALYYNQSVIDEKIEVGYEPMRNFIWDINGRFAKDLDRLTYYLDRLPLIKTDAISSFSIEGEFAQVFPNPNSVINSATGDGNGLAYIDDFEGSKRSNSPSVRHERWEPSSAPIDIASGFSYRQKNRAKLYWYSPFTKYPTKSIWPNQSTSIQANDQTVDILILNYETLPRQSGIERDSIWAGIISPFYSGSYDQTQSKFFEIWLKGNDGKLTVDLGKISEDWNGDGILNTEDKAEAGFVQGNGILDDGEDLGLDGAKDEYEDGWGGVLDSTGLTYQQFLANGETVLINSEVEDIEDPNGDNWFYDDKQDISNYKQVNGTQGNRNAVGGRYPDTEDLDGSGFLDKTNNYFTKTFPLDQSKYFVTETEESDGTPTGWQLFRIPLTHFEKVNNVDWSEIRYIRLVWSGIDDTAELGIAKIELVGNDWQELGIAEWQSNTFIKSDSAFAITVINTEDNPEYSPPKGVKGEYNPIYQKRAKEQSLVLKFENLPVNNRGAAKKTLFSLTGERAQSYLTYDKLKMYVYGEESQWIGSQDTDVELFLQFGLGDQYYEITQPVYSGWDEELDRNAVNLDLNWLTKLKLQDSTNISKINNTDIFIDSADVKQYYFTDEQGNITGKKITIKGEPAISRIQHFIVGVRNKANEPITGQVWIDELRLSGVKKEKGVAMRIQSNLQLADFGKTSVIFSRKDADFHVLQKRLGTNNTNQNVRVNTNLQMHKFLPESWSLSIPINISYSNTNNRPKYYPGSDARVNPSAVPDSIINKSEVISFSTSFVKTRKSKNKWIKYTIDNITGSFSSNKTLTSNEIMTQVKNESYSGKLTYSYAFARDNFFKPLKWLKFVPLFGEKLSETNFYYTPSNLNTGINFSEKLVQRDSRAGARSPDEYNLGLNRTFNLTYKITDNLEAKYNSGTKSDMDEFRAKIIKALEGWNPGIITNTNENLSTTFNPTITKWLKPNFTYSAAYRWSQPLSSSINGANIGTQLRFSSNLSLNLVSVLETVYKPKKETRQRGETIPKRRQRRIVAENETGDSSDDNKMRKPTLSTEEKQDEIFTRKDKQVKEQILDEDIEDPKNKLDILAGLHKMLKKINPLNMTYSSNLNRTGLGVQGEVPTGYKFGWLPDHGLPFSENVGTNTGQWNLVRNLSLRSGFMISTKANINLNYSQELGITRNGGTDLELHSLSRNYFAYGEKLDKGLPFTNWTIRITGLEKWPLIKKFAKSVSLEHAFSGKDVRSWKIEGKGSIPTTEFFGITKFIDSYSDYLVQSRVNSSYSPLIGLTMSLSKGISLNIRHNLSKTAEKSPTGLTLKKEQSISLSSNYTHKGGFTIPLPFFDDYKIQNTMNFTLNADYNSSRTLATKNSTTLTEIAYNTSWKTGLRISYSFSSRVTGAVI
ncbi:MAG: cell surface protein SprA, partial [Planctomycetia bacterium]|nr:cell surface protein SprA [Planctomycetia bacterium]